ncbi:MAG: O-antigen ligase family protein, partial [Trueperaceae bacterium]|nr:O-antigen ligase family protein [Trueperaceae bacterium]
QRIARVAYYRAAWGGFLERPLLGWGIDSFPSYYRLNLPQSGSSGDIPTHSHNLFLQYAFEGGLVGFLGLLSLLLGLTLEAIKKRDSSYITLLIFVLLLNLVDFTFFYNGIAFPVAALAGWRAAGREY